MKYDGACAAGAYEAVVEEEVEVVGELLAGAGVLSD